MPSDGRIEKLFSLPREEFTSARNALAADLSKAGDREGADTVKRFRKPTVSAWAVNQLAQRGEQGVRTLLSAGAQLRQAQTGLLKGGDAKKLREALAAEAEAVDQLVETAAATLAEAGHGASEAILRRVATTLRAAAVDEEAGAALSKGVLTEDLEPRGVETLMEGFAGRGPARARPQDRRRERERERKREQELRRELDARGRELETAEKTAEASSRETAALEKAVQKARLAVEQAEARLNAARSRA